MAEVIELKKYLKGSNEEINKIFHDSVIGIKKYKTNNKDIPDYELESLDFLEGYISNLEIRTKDKSWKPEPIENKFLKHYMFFKDSFGKLLNMNCNQCLGELQKQKIMIKIANNCFPIITYEKTKIVFNISEINSDNQKGTCLYFNKTIFFDSYECIAKPNNIFI